MMSWTYNCAALTPRYAIASPRAPIPSMTPLQDAALMTYV